eukprot:gene23192-29387_t
MLNLGTNPQRLDGKQNLRPRAVSMNDSHSGNLTVKVGSTVYKKRSREKTPTAAATNTAGAMILQSFAPAESVRAPKSPKRSYNKQLVGTVKIESREAPHAVCAPRGDYYNFPPQQQLQQHSQSTAMYAQAQSLPSQSYFDSLRECGFRSHMAAEGEEDELLDMLEYIDWNASPCPSPQPCSTALSSSSPYTDSARSLSSSCENMPLFYSSTFAPPLHCASYSPCTLQQQASPQLHSPRQTFHPSAPTAPVTAEQDELDLFDNFYTDELSQGPLAAAVTESQEAYSRTILHQNTINNANISCSIIPFTAAGYVDKHPHQHEPMHRVTFASVIDELKSKASNFSGGDSYYPISQSFLRPVRPRAESTRLPSLSTLTSGAPPAVVISTSSLTLMDPTFCNYPLMYGDSPPDRPDSQLNLQHHQQQQQQGVSSFGFNGQYMNESGGMSAVSLDSVQQDEASRHYNFGMSYHATPPGMSPATAKKRGRPRKFPLPASAHGMDVATVTPTIASSRSLNSLSTSIGGGGGNRGGMLKISSHPNFPGSMYAGTLQQQQGKHSFDDFLWEGSSLGGVTARSESLFAIESAGALPFPADVGSYSPKPPPSSSSSSYQVYQHQQEAEALYCDPFQHDGDCSDLLLDGEEGGDCFDLGGGALPVVDLPSHQPLMTSSGEPCGGADLGDDMLCFDMLGSVFE